MPREYIGSYHCEIDSSDRLSLEFDPGDGRFAFKTNGDSVWVGPETLREIVGKLADRVGESVNVSMVPMSRADALEKATEHVTKLTTNNRGFTDVSAGDRASMILRFAAFLLGKA